MAMEQRDTFLKITLSTTSPSTEEHSCGFVVFVYFVRVFCFALLLARFVNSLRLVLKSSLCRK